MNLLKRNITVVVLLTAIMVTLSVSFYAIEIQNGSNLDLVTIITKYFEEIEHQTMTAYLRTTSDTIEHKPYVAAGCWECPESVVGWVERTDDRDGLGEKDVRVIKRYPYSCWQQHSTSLHGGVHYDIDRD